MERRRAGLIVMALTVAALGPALLLAGRQAGDAGAGADGGTGKAALSAMQTSSAASGDAVPVPGQPGESRPPSADSSTSEGPDAPSFADGVRKAESPSMDGGKELTAGTPENPRRLPPEAYLDRRVRLEPGETVQVALPPEMVAGAGGIEIRSEDGGVLEGASMAPGIRFAAGSVPESFTYTAGRHRGLYVVSVVHGNESQRLEFWVGEPLPLGKPGPSRNITPPKRQEDAE